jgi:hypothetical protein
VDPDPFCVDPDPNPGVQKPKIKGKNQVGNKFFGSRKAPYRLLRAF